MALRLSEAWQLCRLYPHLELHTGVRRYGGGEGNHYLKFGAAFERLQSNEKPRPRVNGTFIFNNLSDFLTNNPFFFAFAGSTTGVEAGVRNDIIGGYARTTGGCVPI